MCVHYSHMKGKVLCQVDGTMTITSNQHCIIASFQYSTLKTNFLLIGMTNWHVLYNCCPKTITTYPLLIKATTTSNKVKTCGDKLFSIHITSSIRINEYLFIKSIQFLIDPKCLSLSPSHDDSYNSFQSTIKFEWIQALRET